MPPAATAEEAQMPPVATPEEAEAAEAAAAAAKQEEEHMEEAKATEEAMEKALKERAAESDAAIEASEKAAQEATDASEKAAREATDRTAAAVKAANATDEEKVAAAEAEMTAAKVEKKCVNGEGQPVWCSSIASPGDVVVPMTPQQVKAEEKHAEARKVAQEKKAAAAEARAAKEEAAEKARAAKEAAVEKKAAAEKARREMEEAKANADKAEAEEVTNNQDAKQKEARAVKAETAHAAATKAAAQAAETWQDITGLPAGADPEACVSIDASTPTEWCITNCGGSPPNCPAELCKCEAPAGGAPAEAEAEPEPEPEPVDEAPTWDEMKEETKPSGFEPGDWSSEQAAREAAAAAQAAEEEADTKEEAKTENDEDAKEDAKEAKKDAQAAAEDAKAKEEAKQAEWADSAGALTDAGEDDESLDNSGEWDSQGWEDQVAVPDAPHEKVQKGHTLPSTYYINLDIEPDMMERLEGNGTKGSWSGVGKLTRVPAVNKDEVFACMKHGTCSRGPKARMLGLDYMNTEGLLYWKLHELDVFSPGEYGCTFSHLRAIHQAFVDGEQTALIVEDDIRFEDMPLWPETLQDIVAAAPPDWDILQLWTNNPTFYQYFQRGREEGIPPTAKEGVDTTGPVCQEEGGLGGSGTHYNRPAFVPWYDDVYVDWSAGRQVGDAPAYGGLWSTMAYLINRKGMAKVINKLNVGPDRLGNLTLPVLADHILFTVAKTYTYTRPLFRAYPRESTIQPTMQEEIDPTKGRVDPQADPHTLTDGLTNKFIETYWKEGTCPLTTPELKPLNLALLATASFTKTERRIQAANIGRLAKGVDGVRVVTYAINAIDNNVAGWTSSGWTQMAERLGIAAMVVSAGRDKERGFESKLVSQLPLIGHIKRRVVFDYIFTIDGDISFAKADLNGLFSSVLALKPLIAQPTIRTPPSHVNGSMFKWGSQWYKNVNHEEALKCGKVIEYDAPMVESQAAIISTTFLDWYHEDLVQVARVQHEYQCDWGHDEMWCSGALRLSEQLGKEEGGDAPPACLIIRHSVDHHDSKAIEKFENNNKTGGNFISDCQKLEQAYQLDKENEALGLIKDKVVRGKVTDISMDALKDHLSATCINQWADVHGGGCHPPEVGGKYSAVKSYRSFAESKECRQLADEKTAAEEAFALSKLGSNPSFADTADDMLSKGRRLYGSHFTPTGRQLHDVRADIHPGQTHPGHWALSRLQDVLDRWGPFSR